MPTHAEKRIITYSPEQMFDLVAAVDLYPEFLPWCTGASIRYKDKGLLLADLKVGFGPFKEVFGSRVDLFREENKIVVTYDRGPLKYLSNQWLFLPDPQGCMIDFFVDFEFRSKIMQKAMGLVFNEAVQKMVTAFVKRADFCYADSYKKAQ
ncbi:Ribosome association toxin PasT (RatA) of the RatAB toxin-antitoxin module (PasT) (PDB:1T17) (PUBMED:21323758) [Commensalibacter communis]|uniref:Ribosome association toxin PasT (RatA) of the RatAB toxin-antitoxin module (PasT) n=1 Tax=Commensalibacter communis TaxID=2972786 RepID=A0A9W4TNW9_9PROT|nr:type II toxin-antitoxin system RatA family toxin [Commensalibacter communis]CAI3926964.1 Ribosome association toxin PasT (RatA) of the RatAB toxin-antitoxin module (PasT) (PDB:1T17) (PUBMED:21323758) [Commensalibacter communis]CAI3927570.1 Ribosome association toxin PasT (RatA) of the RatAB toxin-antitoxin module (PasT) (PDB:1T17) (PUBMED:21323758) [Commensalibacter communis]CAI3933896.1 Ribosome association toxin PasT (RatA) of the RatAB toxin-antitoxin module (PasT) (PDB:1T17) (PUBMED:21323